jgi:prepilin-type N-terminal cleavage/methylation domain-containing protein
LIRSKLELSSTARVGSRVSSPFSRLLNATALARSDDDGMKDEILTPREQCYLASRMSSRHGFTLLEIMLAMLIGLLLTSIAVPSVMGMMREQKLRATFDEFDDFVRSAQRKAMKARKTYVMVWEDSAVVLGPVDASASDEPGAVERFAFAEDSRWSLVRPAALVKKPVWEWPFWSSGSCEPVVVNYAGEYGTWSAEYRGLTARGRITDMEVK